MGAAFVALSEDPLPADGFHAGEYHRLRVGTYRVVYVVEADFITVSRVDRAPARLSMSWSADRRSSSMDTCKRGRHRAYGSHPLLLTSVASASLTLALLCVSAAVTGMLYEAQPVLENAPQSTPLQACSLNL